MADAEPSMVYCSSCKVYQKPLVKNNQRHCRSCGMVLDVPVQEPVRVQAGASAGAQPGQAGQVKRPFPWLGIAQTVIIVLLVMLVINQQQAVIDSQSAPASSDEEGSAEDITTGTTKDSPKPAPRGAVGVKDLMALQKQMSILRSEIQFLERDTEKSLEIILEDVRRMEKGMASARDAISRVDKDLKALDSGQNLSRTELAMVRKSIVKLEEVQVELQKRAKQAAIVKNRLQASAQNLAKTNAANAAKQAAAQQVAAQAQPEPTPQNPVNTGVADGAAGSRASEEAPRESAPGAKTKVWADEWKVVQVNKDEIQRRQFIFRILSDADKKDGLPVFLSAMEDPDLVVRKFAYAGLKEASGMSQPFSPGGSIGERTQQIQRWKQVLAAARPR